MVSAFFNANIKADAEMCLSFLIGRKCKMKSWEDAILDRQESETDECKECEYKQRCKNQCNEVHVVYNQNLRR